MHSLQLPCLFTGCGLIAALVMVYLIDVSNPHSGRTVLADRAALFNGCGDSYSEVDVQKLEREQEVGGLYEFMLPTTFYLIGFVMAAKLIVHSVFHCMVLCYSCKAPRRY